jgi:hypothetical protein
LIKHFGEKHPAFNPQDFTHVFGDDLKLCQASSAAYVVSLISIDNCFDNQLIQNIDDITQLSLYSTVVCEYFTHLAGAGEDEFIKINAAIGSYITVSNLEDRFKKANIDYKYTMMTDIKWEDGNNLYQYWAGGDDKTGKNVINLFVSSIYAYCENFEIANLFTLRKFIEQREATAASN